MTPTWFRHWVQMQEEMVLCRTGFIHRPTFPKLRNLVSLDQKVLDVVRWESNIGDGDDLQPR